MFDKRIDYLDMQIHRGPRDGVMKFKEVDEDGIEYETKLTTHDRVAFEFFQMLGIFPETKTRMFCGEFCTPERDIFWISYDLNASLQLKGGFFIRPDYKELLAKIIAFLKVRNITFTVSRTDLALTFDYGESFFTDLMKCDYKNLIVKPRMKKKKIHYLICENSRFEMAAYCKTTQLAKVKAKDAVYKTNFLQSLRLTEMPETNLYRIDLRLRQKDMNAPITLALQKENINFEEIEAEIIKQAEKRMKFSKKMGSKIRIKG